MQHMFLCEEAAQSRVSLSAWDRLQTPCDLAQDQMKDSMSPIKGPVTREHLEASAAASPHSYQGEAAAMPPGGTCNAR